jgi:hypothetical protein
MFRCIPTSRLKPIIDNLLLEYREETAPKDKGISALARDIGVDSRRLALVVNEEQANFTFDFVDKILTRLDLLYLWHMPAEAGGLSDYYYPDIPPAPAPDSVDQSRRRTLNLAKQASRSRGISWMDALHEKALREEEEQGVAA